MIQLPLPGLLTEETIVPYLLWRHTEVYENTWYPQLRYDAQDWTRSFEQQEWFITRLIPQTVAFGPTLVS